MVLRCEWFESVEKILVLGKGVALAIRRRGREGRREKGERGKGERERGSRDGYRVRRMVKERNSDG